MTGKLHQHRARSLKALAVATAVAAVAMSAIASTASAINFGPNLRGSGSGYIFCDQFRHQLTLSYTAAAETSLTMGVNSSAINVSGTSTLSIVPEWIEVASYVKPASGGSWTFVKDDVVLLNTVGNRTVTQVTLPARQGSYWTAGFYVRVAYPGSAWSSWFWEPAPKYMSLSGSVSAQYDFCLT